MLVVGVMPAIGQLSGLTCPRLKKKQPLGPRTEPYGASVIFQNKVDARLQPIAQPIVHKTLAGRLEATETEDGANPDLSLTIFVDGHHRITVQTRRIRRIRTIDGERLPAGIEPRQSAPGGDP